MSTTCSRPGGCVLHHSGKKNQLYGSVDGSPAQHRVTFVFTTLSAQDSPARTAGENSWFVCR